MMRLRRCHTELYYIDLKDVKLSMPCGTIMPLYLQWSLAQLFVAAWAGGMG